MIKRKNTKIDKTERPEVSEDVEEMSSEGFKEYIKELDESKEEPESDDATEPEKENDKKSKSRSEIFVNDDKKSDERKRPPKNDRAYDEDDDEELLNEIKETARTVYGDKRDAVRAMLNELKSSAAKRVGMSVEDFTERQRDRRDAQSWRTRQRQESDIEARKKQKLEEWERDTKNLKLMDPSFDFEQAMENEAFYNAIVSGKSVFEAYKTAEKEEPQRRHGRRPISQNGQIPGVGTGVSTRNPASLSSADFKAYIDKIKNG